MDFEGAYDIQSVRIYPKYPSSGRLSGSTVTLMNNEERLAYTTQINDADDIEMFDIDVSNFVSLEGGMTILCLAHLCCMVSCCSLSIYLFTHIGSFLCFFMTR